MQCSLIETIDSFINGWVYNHKNFNNLKKGWYDKIVSSKTKSTIITINESIFISFFDNQKNLNLINGADFYQDVRCPCLHETQTKNNWLIRSDKDQTNFIFLNKKGIKIIYRENFQKELENIIEKYKKAIIHGTQLNNITSGNELRQNFIAKMNHICNNS